MEEKMVQVTELGYMGIGVKDLDAWKKFAAELVGLEISDDGERDRFYLRMDYWHHRLIVHADKSDDMLYLGFRVAGAEEFSEMQHQLTAADIKFRIGSEEEAEERKVIELLKLADPDGNPVEIFHGPHVQFSRPFHPGRRMHGRFKTGTGGMGHCVIREKDPKAAYRFYSQLGMRGGVEYKIRMGKHIVTPIFMHCNDRDHTVAFGFGGGGRRINHLMIEVDNLDDVGLTYDLVRQNKVPVTIAPGKHSNDHMFSFYFRNPSGWIWEYGFGARAATYQSEYYSEDVYGHQMEAGGFDMPTE
jgi:2,3-dihydroxybiphenyl 1,2-dioxygenase